MSQSHIQAADAREEQAEASARFSRFDMDWPALERDKDQLPAGVPGWAEKNIRSLLTAASRNFPECGFALGTFDGATDLPAKFLCSEGTGDAVAAFFARCKWRADWQTFPASSGEGVELPGGFRDLAAGQDERLPSGKHHLLIFAMPGPMRTMLAVWRAGEYGPFRAPEMAPLRDKAQSAAAIVRLGRELFASNTMELAAALDRLKLGFIVIDRSMRVSLANDAAQAMLDQGDYLKAADKALKFPDPASESRLRQLVSHIQSLPKKSADASGVIALRSQNGEGLVRCIVNVQRDAEDSLLGPLLFGLTISAQNRPGATHPAELRRLGFTPAEAELVADLLKGLTVSRHAEERGIAVATARAHLKRAMMRMGVHRQADLIRHIVGLR